METCFNYTDRERAFFSSDERRFINKVRALKEKYPEEVRIIAEPEENEGCIYCELPAAWFTIRVPKKMNFSEEHLAELSERMRQRAIMQKSNDELQEDLEFDYAAHLH